MHDAAHLFVLCKQGTLVQVSLAEWQDHKQSRAGQGTARRARAEPRRARAKQTGQKQGHVKAQQGIM